MITYDEALGIILAKAHLMPIISCENSQSLGYISAKSIQSPEQLPAFANSAMDGFAIKSKETGGASETTPVTFNVQGSVRAGVNVMDKKTQDELVWEITTGAPIPKDVDTVVKLEDVRVLEVANDVPKKIAILSPIPKDRNIRYPGEDFKEDDPVLPKGQRIEPEHIMALSALGIDRVDVYQKPKIGIICSGSELSNKEQKLSYGQIRNSNLPYLQACLAQSGFASGISGVVSDEPNEFVSLLEKMIERDNPNIIVSTGAVSKGRWDFIPDTLDKLGAKIFFHNVKIRPGKPMLFARLKNGTYYFGLPGNPVAVAVGWRFFVWPIIRSIQGRDHEKPLNATLKSLENAKIRKDFVGFCKGKYFWNSEGFLEVDILQGQEAFKIHSLLTANCWVKLTPDELEPAQRVEIYPFKSLLF